MKEITMSIPEFFQVQREELSIDELNSLDKEIICNKKLRSAITLLLALTVDFKVANAANGAQAAAKLGGTFLNMVRSFGYWICVVMCIVEIIRNLLQGDTKGIGKIIVKYLIAFASFYFVPFLFDTVREAFAG